MANFNAVPVLSTSMYVTTVASLYQGSDANFSETDSINATTLLPVNGADLYRIHRPTVALTDKYVTLLMYVIGFPGNVLAFVVWIQQRMRHSSGCYLAALAFVDFIFLSLQLVFELHKVWSVPTLNVSFVCEIFPVFFIASQHLSPLLVLGFTVERFIAVCYPFQHDRFCTTSRAIKVICALAAGCLALHAVQAYFWHYDALASDCRPRDSVTEGGALSVWSLWSWVTELVDFALVPLAILTLNLCVIRETRRIARRERQELCLRGHTVGWDDSRGTARLGDFKKNGKGRGVNDAVFRVKSKVMVSTSVTTVTLLAVSFYLIFTTLPVTICYVLYQTFPAGSPDKTTFERFTNDVTWQRHLNYVSVKTVVEEIGMSHYACNIIIYLATGHTFRKELWRVFSRCFPSHPHRNHRRYDVEQSSNARSHDIGNETTVKILHSKLTLFQF